MSWTKRQIVAEAFAELRLTSAFDVTPEEVQTALRRLDTMMAIWASRGISFGFPIPSDPTETDPDQETGLPDAAVEAVYTSLAVRIAPTMGKAVAPETRQAAALGYARLAQDASAPVRQEFPPTLPMGAGNRAGRFFPAPQARPLDANDDGNLDFLG